MKKESIVLLIASIMVMLFLSCEEMEHTTVKQDILTCRTTIRSPQEALEIATNATSMLKESDKQTRSVCKTRRVSNSLNPIVARSASTRSGANAFSSDTLMYIFNYDNNEGFAIVSANRSTEAILAVADSGNIKSIESIDNPGLAIYLSLAKNYVARASAIPGPSTLIDSTVTVKGPFIQVAWGQRFPEGNLFNNGLSGCTNTAIAQIMTCFGYPSQISYSEGGNTEIVNLDWTEIRKHKRTSGNTCMVCTASSSTHSTISKFIRQLGLWNRSIDSYSGQTMTFDVFLTNSLDSLGYSHSNDFMNYTSGVSQGEISFRKLLLMDGQAMVDGTSVGHSWVIDGLRQVKKRISTWTATGHNEIITETINYNHVNWGWNGLANGFYADNVFDTGRPVSTDNAMEDNDPMNFGNVKYMKVYKSLSN